MHVLVVMLVWCLRRLPVGVAGNAMRLRRVMELRLRARSIMGSWRSVRLHWCHCDQIKIQVEGLVKAVFDLLWGGCC